MKSGFARSLMLAAGLTTLAQLHTQSARAQAAVLCVNCSDLVTQIIQQAEQAASLAKQISQYSLQIQQFQNQVQNTTLLPQNIWTQITGDILAVTNIANQASLLAGTTGSQIGLLNSPGSYNARLGNIPLQVSSLNAYQQQIGNSLSVMGRQIGLQQTQSASTAAIINQVAAQSSSAVGQLAAIQAGNELAQSLGTELAGIQGTLTTTAQLVATQQSKQADEDSTDNAWMAQFVGATPPSYTGNPGY